MPELGLGPLRLIVEHRSVGGAGGPTLRVCDERRRELLRFDCFDRGAHFHVEPLGRDLRAAIEGEGDPVAWTIAEIRRDLAGYLKRAGYELEQSPASESLEATLERVEAEMRNPPEDFDVLDLESLRESPGEKWALYPGDVIPAWVADMDFPVAEPIRTVLRRAADRSYLGYPINPRVEDLPTLFAERARTRYAWEVDPRRVEILTDVVQGIYVGLQRFSGPDDGVVVQTPIYPPFLEAVRETGRRLVDCPLVAGDARYEIDFDALRGAIDARTRVLLLCHPHNPTGRVFTRAELEALAELAIERDLCVISDEIHADLVYPGHRHVVFATLGPEVGRRTLTLMSASKAFNIASLRCAVAAFGSDELQRSFLEVPRHVRGGISGLSLAATEAAWRHGQPWLDRALAYLEGNRDFLLAFLKERLPDVRCLPPEATYLAWLDCRALELEPSPYEFFLERGRVALSDGRRFGRPGRGFARINFATSRVLLTEILERMARAVAERDSA